MAYKKRIQHECLKCNRNAIVEIFNNYNASCGKYCNRCGDIVLKRLRIDGLEDHDKTEKKT